MSEIGTLDEIVKKWFEIARYKRELKFDHEVVEDMDKIKNELDLLLEGLGIEKKESISKDHLKYERMRIDEYSKLMRKKNER